MLSAGHIFPRYDVCLLSFHHVSHKHIPMMFFLSGDKHLREAAAALPGVPLPAACKKGPGRGCLAGLCGGLHYCSPAAKYRHCSQLEQHGAGAVRHQPFECEKLAAAR